MFIRLWVAPAIVADKLLAINFKLTVEIGCRTAPDNNTRFPWLHMALKAVSRPLHMHIASRQFFKLVSVQFLQSFRVATGTIKLRFVVNQIVFNFDMVAMLNQL